MFDWDDAYTGHDQMDRLVALKEIRPDFRCTLFAIPARCSLGWLDRVASQAWIELAVHGWNHDTVYECSAWTEHDLARCLDSNIVQTYFVDGFKAPGWQISDGCYRELLHRGWWVADQHLEDQRRPPNLAVYFYEDGNWHGHIQNVCGNGIEETWDRLVEAVRSADSFEFASEAARVHPDPHDRRS